MRLQFYAKQRLISVLYPCNLYKPNDDQGNTNHCADGSELKDKYCSFLFGIYVLNEVFRVN